jgi:indole-3-glycerol phosphate synthase
MTTILDKIVAHKRQEVAHRKKNTSIATLEQRIKMRTPVFSLREQLLSPGQSGIIAEFKRRSPSRGIINAEADITQVTTGYLKAGASALSVLTDEHFFGGRDADLEEARQHNRCPILRKDFVIDEYQIIEACAIGADAILLIAECLTPDQLRHLAATAKQLGLEVLMELHAADQIDKLNEHVDLVGVNNRNLKDFSVSLAASFELAQLLPASVVKVSESGIDDPNAVVALRREGFRGFLIGDYFMRHADPAQTCRDFIGRVGRLQEQIDGGIAGGY